MRFGVLGSLTVEDRGARIATPAGMLRRLLAALLSRAGESVPVNDLVDALWPDEPPVNAVKTVQIYVHRLRRRLREPELILRRPTGYAIVVGPGELDAQTFVDRIRQAREARTAGRLERAADQLRRALHLWRGAPYEDLDGCAFIRPEVQRLTEWRARALEDRAVIELDQGRHAELIPELSGRVAEDPHRERLCALLMVALYRSGRPADALQEYQRLRTHLAEELGVDPGQPVRDLYAAMLRNAPLDGRPAGSLVSGDPGPATTTSPPVVPRPVPAELCPDVVAFTGRSAELARLDAFLDGAGTTHPSATMILAVTGTAGVGKTALLAHWSHRVRHRFPDGQLWLDLRGYAPGSPMSPIDALAQLLRAFGVPAEKVPERVDEAAGMYRSLLADRRVLVVLDNAAGADQVRPLLPGSAGCLVLVSSRDKLGGLVARDGAQRVPLGVLTTDEAATLLGRLLGRCRVEAEPAATAHLARVCAHLPLALRIAAANLNDQPHRTVAGYVAELAAGNPLGVLEVDGDEQVAVRATFDLSYARLAPATQRLFRLLGLVPGPDFTADAAAALVDTTTAQARRLLSVLGAAHLIEQRDTRFAFHDLLRAYAAERARRDDGEPDRSAATSRLYDHYLRHADAAARLLYPAKLRLALPTLASQGEPALFDDHAQASAWLDAERRNLVAAVVHTADHGPCPVAWLLADLLRNYFYLRMYTVDWLATARAGLAAAQAAGELRAQAAGQLSLALLHRRKGAYGLATDHYRRALALAEQTGWTEGVATVLNQLGGAHLEGGRPADAIGYFRRAYRLAEQGGWLGVQANALAHLGGACWELGQVRQAIEYHTCALALHRKIGSPDGETIDLGNLAEAWHAQGEFDRALDLHADALTLRRQVGNRPAEAGSLLHLAAVHRDAGRYDRALDLATAALDLACTVEYRRVGLEALNVLGSVHRCLGDLDRAVGLHQRALASAREDSGHYAQIESAIGLAAAQRCAGRIGEARHHVHQALAMAVDGGYRLLEGHARTTLAAVHLDHGDPAAATSQARQALAIHRETGHRLGIARTQLVLGEALSRAGHAVAARTHREQARSIAAEIGAADVC
jgi:DNA-binding SARP family transcriptional activator/Tfp pilus assembly protein PilF